MEHVHNNPELAAVLDLIGSGAFAHGDRELFQPLIDNLLTVDPYLALADFADYCACQEQVGMAYRDSVRWTRMSILNSARSGLFSSDRTIREYCQHIWRVAPVHIRLLDQEDNFPGRDPNTQLPT
jgi:starch phosphorylase